MLTANAGAEMSRRMGFNETLAGKRHVGSFALRFIPGRHHQVSGLRCYPERGAKGAGRMWNSGFRRSPHAHVISAYIPHFCRFYLIRLSSYHHTGQPEYTLILLDSWRPTTTTTAWTALIERNVLPIGLVSCPSEWESLRRRRGREVTHDTS